jgi:ankyrin repeat protein
MMPIKLTCLDPAGNDTVITYQNTVLQYHLPIVIFGKNVMIY